MTSPADRATIIQQLREELVGPAPTGQLIPSPPKFETKEESYSPRRQADGEEILQRTPPTLRYGVGVLYPFGTPISPQGHPIPEGGAQEPEASQVPADVQQDIERTTVVAEEVLSRGHGEADDDPTEFDLSSANTYEASSMAISFVAELPTDGILEVDITGGRYEPLDVLIAGKTAQWYYRRPLRFCLNLPVDRLRVSAPTPLKLPAIPAADTDPGPLHLQVEVLSRPAADGALLTVALVNRTPVHGAKDRLCLFQTHFRACVTSPHSGAHILPYPETPHMTLDEEEQGLSLLYRSAQTFAVGHGCAADWESNEGASRARSVSAECLPMVETPSVTPEIRRVDGSQVQVSMAALAGLVPDDDGLEALEEVITLYEDWIAKRRRDIDSLEGGYRAAASRHLRDCSACAQRMRSGLSYLKTDDTAQQAFRLANHAILLQQIAARLSREPRRAELDEDAHRTTFLRPFPTIDPSYPPDGVGYWRPFQIAFLLMTLQSAVDGCAPDRATVELIWFPTGGGKTEAYLGLTAFSLFVRRIRDPKDTGVNVIMRYTLRLLTAQQFQRASALITAMEVVRRDATDMLGKKPFSIGIWLGQSTTPNTKQEARSALRALQKGARENKLLLRQCPWCGAQMGPIVGSRSRRRGKQETVVLGYESARQTVVFCCPDSECLFSDGMPVYVVDEDIYEVCPSLVIGTVDKFAMLAWRPEARSLFGLDKQGIRVSSPPGLIIQDELHLIAGPLGSIVGLYEPVIEDLCTDKRTGMYVPPKLVSSTATIRRYREQIRALYGRDEVVLFPPSGLDAGDSFFGSYARLPNGSLAPGRMYVGVNGPGLGSQLTAVVRSFTALLQGAMSLPSEARDPWWTLMVFFNTLRELGTSLSLLQSDIPDYVVGMRNRMGKESAAMRFPRNVLELTSRIRNDEVPQAIEELEVTALSADPRPVDICLASSIIEVGIDVDRLSLMGVVSQPKTTSQYIQVTGRVGRRWWERPGLITTIYSPSRPRDRSHFEKFRSYHERLYAQVEPTSVTPFSPPALARALHAAMIAYVRQSGAEDVAPYPFPAELVDDFARIMDRRAAVAADGDDQIEALGDLLTRRKSQWMSWEPRKWRAGRDDRDPGLMYAAGEFIPPEWAMYTWPVQQSLRTVDAECQAVITRLYKNHEEELS